MPTVSVIVPCYNYAQYLGQCLESILGQEGFSDFELIVVDDGSTDSSPEVIRRLRDPRVTALRHEKNLGHIQAVNVGFRQASGRYLARIDADDYWHPEFLAATVPVLERSAEVGLVHTNGALVDAEGRITQPRGTGIPFSGDFQGNELPYLLRENYLFPHGVLFRKECLDFIGGRYTEEIPYSEDWRLWLAIGKRMEFTFLDRLLVYYRCHPQNLHARLARAKLAEVSEIRILEEFFQDPMLSAQLRRLRSKAMGGRYRAHGEIYFGFGMRADSRRCLWRAAQYQPAFLLHPGFWKRFIAGWLPAGIYEKIQGMSRGTA